MSIIAILRTENGLINVYDPSAYTWAQVVADIATVKYVFAMYKTNTTSTQVLIDVNAYVAANPGILTQPLTTWASVRAVLTDAATADVVLTSTAIPLSTIHQVQTGSGTAFQVFPCTLYRKNNQMLDVVCLDTTHHYLAMYGNYAAPSWETFRVLENLPDVKIRTNSPIPISMPNTLPILNGIAHLPAIDDNGVLYIREGVRSFRGWKRDNPGSLLVDFSEFLPKDDNKQITQNIEVIPLTQALVSQYSINIPAETDLTDKFMIVVIAGKLYFSNEFTLTDHKLTFQLDRLELEASLLFNAAIRSEYTDGTTVLEVPTPAAYLNTMIDARYYENFIILVPNANLVRHQQPLQWSLKPNMLVFPTMADGLLQQQGTRAIYRYVRNLHSQETVLAIPPPLPLAIVDSTPNHDMTYGALRPKNFYNGLTPVPEVFSLFNFIH